MSSRLRHLAPWGALLVLSSCATTVPRSATLPDLPGEWTASSGEEAATSAPADTPTPDPWWAEFGDPRLDRVIAEALASNRDLRAAAARRAAAMAEAEAAGAALWPTVDGSWNGSRRRQNFIGFPLPGGDGGPLSTTTTTYQTGLSVAWEADLWGRLRDGRDAALATAAAQSEDFRSARLSLTARTAQAWLEALEAKEQVELAGRILENRQRSLRRVEARFQAGLRTSLDVRRARSLAATAEAELADRRSRLDAAGRTLEILLGRYPAARLEIDGGLPDLPPPVPAGLPSDLVARRPDLRAAELRLTATGLDADAARKAIYPRLTLTGSAGTASEELGNLLDGDFSVWSLAGGILQPIFQGGRLRAAATAAEDRYRAGAESYVQAALVAFGEVERALAAEHFLRTRLTAIAVAAEEAEAARRLAQSQYEIGLIDYLNVLDADQESAGAESRRLETRRRLLSARIDLHLALGGAMSPLHIEEPS